MKLSIVIPAYNEGRNIQIIINELLKNIELLDGGIDYEILVVDDHSSDNTYEIVSRLLNTRIACLRLSRRCGSHVALRAGIAHATGDAVLCISADGQDDPSYLKAMWAKWQNGAAVIWAIRKDRKNEPLYIKVPARIFYYFLSLVSGIEYKNIDLFRVDFFLLDKKIADAVNSCLERNTSLFGLIAWIGFKQDFVEYERRFRYSGMSKWNFQSRFHLAKDWIIAFSGLPLKFMSICGFFVALIGFLYGSFVILNSILSRPVPGWASIIVSVFVLGGIQMIMLGIIGEYLWRNLDESRKRPLYFIENKSRGEV